MSFVMHAGILIFFDQDTIIVETTANGIWMAGSHAPIVIDGDIELDSFPDKIGDGTEHDPYIINGFIISATFDGISVGNTSRHLVIKDCTITSGSGSGILMEDCQNVQIINCTLISNYYGVWAGGLQMANLHIINCTVQSSGGTGIFITMPYSIITSISVSGNRVNGSGRHGVEIFASFAMITRNMLTNNSIGGLRCWGQNLIVSDNIISGNDEGIDQLGSNVVISNNIVENNTGAGIVTGKGATIWRHYYNTFENNTVSNNGRTGIIASSLTESTFAHNTILSNQGAGLAINNSIECDVHDNIFGNNSGGNLIETNSTTNWFYRNQGAMLENKFPDDGPGVLYTTLVVAIAVPVPIIAGIYVIPRRARSRKRGTGPDIGGERVAE